MGIVHVYSSQRECNAVPGPCRTARKDGRDAKGGGCRASFWRMDMHTPATLTYKTPVARTVAAACILLAAMVLVNMLMYHVNGKIFGPLWTIVILGPCLALSRGGVTLERDSMTIRRGFCKKEYPLSGGTFVYGHKSGVSALVQSLCTQTNFFRIRQEGKNEVIMPVNIPRADFEILVTAMRERGAMVQAL